MNTMTQVVPATLAFAQGLFTRGTDAFGVEEVTRALRFPPDGDRTPPPIPFTEDELRRARELNQYLILQGNAYSEKVPITMQELHRQFKNKLGGGKLLYDTNWYAKEPFYTTDTPRLGWRLVSREVIPGSTSEDYIGQTQAIADYLTGKVYAGEDLPEAYQAAVSEFEDRKTELEKLRDSDWKKCAEELAGLKLNQFFREKPVEVIYGLIVQHEINRERLLADKYTWTIVRSSRGDLVLVGGCVWHGVGVVYYYPRYSHDNLGARFSRSAVPDLES